MTDEAPHGTPFSNGAFSLVKGQERTDHDLHCRHYCAKEDEDGNVVRSAGRRILPEKVKEVFREKQLVCYEFMNLTDAQERDLFQRVQKGVQLTKAEQFRATRGEWQSFAEMYERDFPKVVNRKSSILP
jgi:hypothetical protein